MVNKLTRPKVARQIEKATGIEKVWNQRGWDYLEKSKYSRQKPRPKYKKGDHYAQENFNRNWPLIVFDILQGYYNLLKEAGITWKKTHLYQSS